MNNWSGIGRLTKDPAISYISETQMCVAKFIVAIDDGWGEKKRTDFIPVTVFGKKAESCERFLTKGKLVGIEGKIQTGSYINKEGQKVYTTDIVASKVEFLEWDKKKTAQGNDDLPEGFRAIPDDEYMPFG